MYTSEPLSEVESGDDFVPIIPQNREMHLDVSFIRFGSSLSKLPIRRFKALQAIIIVLNSLLSAFEEFVKPAPPYTSHPPTARSQAS